MNYKKIIFAIVLVLACTNGRAQSPAKRILYKGAVAHTGNGAVITNSAIGVSGGKFTLVGNAELVRIDASAYDTVIDLGGKHVYPGLIALNTTLGLSEIEAVRATNDFNETGSLNPSVRSIVAYNTDSKVIPTVRSNGVLLAQIVPRGGTVSGQSSVVMLDGWNYEDASYKTDEGIHLKWPSMRISTNRESEPESKQQEQIENSIAGIRSLLQDAQAWYRSGSPSPVNLHLESMKGLFDGSKKLYIHCNYVKEIIAAAGMAGEMGISAVIVGGSDAWMVTGLLKERNIAVVINETHRLPSRIDEPVDMPYELPAVLSRAGVQFAISINGFWQVRNLSFQAGTAAGYGLTKEEAIQAITLSPARILGIDKTTGSIEEGKDATFFVSEGDVLDMTSSNISAAWIRGNEIPLDNFQDELERKFSDRGGE